MEYKIELTQPEVNQILTALGNMPYVQVFELVDKIRIQANQQMQEQPLAQPEKSLITENGQ